MSKGGRKLRGPQSMRRSPRRTRSGLAGPKSPADTRRIMAKLSAQHPNADTELHFENAYQLLVATILSAQCTDERVNQVTPALFKRYPDARALARATPEELEPQIQSTGFFRAKSRSLVGMSRALVEHHHGEIPPQMDALVKLPGVGRKTANVVLGHALGVPGLPVDRHVLRVANRLGIARSEDPAIVEQQLCAALPAAEWTRTSDTLILHGRRICKPRPLCDRCAVRELCDFFQAVKGAMQASPKRLRPGAGAASGSSASRTKRPETGKAIKVRRGPEARGRGPAGPVPTRRAESGKAIERHREPEAPDAGRAGPVPTRRAESGKAIERRREPEAPDAGRAGPVPTRRAESGKAIERHREPEAPDAGRAGPVPTRRAESGKAIELRRAESGKAIELRRGPEARGTGRGGGAPRQNK